MANGAGKGKAETARTAITPTRNEDYAEWYQQVVRAADLAENSPVRGCMVIKPWGYAHLGEHPARARRDVQGDRAQERLLPALHPEVVPREGSRARRGLRQGVRRRHAPPARSQGPDGGLIPDPEAKLEEPLDRAADVARRSSAPCSRTGSRATATCRCSSTSGRTSCAGSSARGCSSAPPSSSGRRGTPRTRPRTRRAEETRTHARRLRDFAEELHGDARAHAARRRASERFPGAVDTYCDRGDDAGPQGAPGRHLALPRPELREGERHQVPDREGDARSSPGRRRGASPRGSSAA